MGNTRSFFGNEKLRSIATFWIPIFFLLSFFFINQFIQWYHHLSGDSNTCSACPYSVTGLEVLWAYFPLMGAYASRRNMSERNVELFERYLMPALIALISLTSIKFTLRFSNPYGLSFWLIGLLLELDWLYVSLANLLIWISLYWKAESAKAEDGLSIAQRHCLIYYCLPTLLMVLAVINYRALEYFNYDADNLLLAGSIAEFTFVISPVKATLSWHFRP